MIEGEQLTCYLHAYIPGVSTMGNMFKFWYTNDLELHKLIEDVINQYAASGHTPTVKLLTVEEGDKMMRCWAVQYFPLWQDLVNDGTVVPLVFEN